MDDDGIYQRARAIVCAEIQEITYRDFIPVLLGPNALTLYAGYNETVDPRVSIVFSTAGFRLGHTMLPADLRLAPASGEEGERHGVSLHRRGGLRSKETTIVPARRPSAGAMSSP